MNRPSLDLRTSKLDKRKKRLARKNDADTLKDTLREFKIVSELYGFKLPENPKIAMLLARHFCMNFAYDPKVIQKAFELCVMGEMGSVNMIPYGKILTVPVITEVFTEYKMYLNRNEKKIKPAPKNQVEVNMKNMQTMLNYLDHLCSDRGKWNKIHYNLIDQFICKFDAQVKIDEYEIQLKKIESSLRAEASAGQISVSMMRRSIGSQSVSLEAKTNAMVELVAQFLKSSCILKEIVKSEIIYFYKLKSNQDDKRG